MKNSSVLVFLLIFFLPLLSPAQSGQLRVLIFHKTLRYRHASIGAGLRAIAELGKAHGFAADSTQNPDYFTDDTLRRYAAVIFLNTTGDVLNPAQEAAFERYIQSGGGFAGIHSASATEYDWPWFGKLTGAFFKNHPPDPVPGVVLVQDARDPSTKHLPKRWNWKDEWYNFRTQPTDVHVLLKADETTYAGGTHGADHPLAWKHESEGGRAFYTALGHLDEAYSDPLYRQHILAGIQYAMGKKNPRAGK